MNKFFKWALIVLVIIVAILIIFGTPFSVIYHNFCEISVNDSIGYKNYNEGNKSKIINNISISWADDKWIWIKRHILLCEEEDLNIFEKGVGFVKGIFGFNESFYTFIPYLLVGLLVGVWLRLIYLLASLDKPWWKWLGGSSEAKNKWIGFIGSAWWKIIPIAVLYATLMQIPIVNAFIRVVTLEVFLRLASSSVWDPWSGFIKSFIIAFYIGLLPTIIEEYTRYRIRKNYYNQLQRIKFEKKVVQELGRG